MKIILLQGLNHNIGVSSICSAFCYSLSQVGKHTVCVDGNQDALGNSISHLFGLDQRNYGWVEAIDQGTTLSNEFNKFPVFYKYDDRCYFIPLGDSTKLRDQSMAQYFASKLLEHLKEYSKIDFVVIDGGIKGSNLASAFQFLSDLTLTVISVDGNSMLRLDSTQMKKNEYLLINRFNKFIASSSDIILQINQHKYRDLFMKSLVSFDENMISFPVMPTFSEMISSASDEQSVPQPSSCRILRMVGLGVAFTAKYSLNPLFHENASYTAFAFSIIPFSS